MILPERFTTEELRKEIILDRCEVENKFRNYFKTNVNKILRYVRNLPPTTQFPLDGPTKHFKTSNNNHWYCYYSLSGKESFLKNHEMVFSCFCIAESAKGKYVYLPSSGKDNLDAIESKPDNTLTIKVYKPHYFRRYKEREVLDSNSSITNDIDFIELVKHHLYYNVSGIDSKHCDELRRQFDDSEIVEIMNSGFGLGKQLDKYVSIMETYISWDMALPEQEKLFEKLRMEKLIFDIQNDNYQFIPDEMKSRILNNYRKL